MGYCKVETTSTHHLLYGLCNDCMGLCCQSHQITFLFEVTAFDNIAHYDNKDINFISELHFVHQVVRAVPLFLVSLYHTVNSLRGRRAQDQLLLSVLEGGEVND